MRLTLRTMLAYLDEVLPEDDAKILQQKIEESEFATGLVNRIRTSTRHLRLGAPKLDGQGVGLDPNTVAEYLDNALSQDRVSDFERVCLESDVHLAEVAACHQILTLVLEKAADVEPEMRERMYTLHERRQADTAAAAAGPEDAEQPADPPPAPSSNGEPVAAAAGGADDGEEKEVVAEVLHHEAETDNQIRMMLVAAVVLLIAVSGALIAVQSGWLPIAAKPAESPQQPAGEGGAKGDEGAGGEPAGAGATAKPATADPAAAGRPAPAVGTAAGTPAGAGAAPKPADGTPAGAAKTPPGAGAAKPGEAGTGAGAATPPVKPAEPGKETGPATKPPMKTPDTVAGAPVAPPTKKPETPATSDEPPEVARLTSIDEVVFRLPPGAETWSRIEPAAVLHAGDRLIVPPAYRPAMLTADGVQWMFAGPSSLTLGDVDAQKSPLVVANYARAVVFTTKAGAAVRLAIGERVAQATFDDAKAQLGIDIQRYLPPGGDPQADSQLVVQVMANKGSITWREGDRDHPVTEKQMLVMIDDGPPLRAALPELPEWTSLTVREPTAQMASSQLHPKVPFDRPVNVSLRELVGFRQAEVSALVIDSLTQLGIVAPAIDALRNEKQRSYWGRHYDALRRAMAESPARAAEIRDLLESSRGEDGALLYRLLRGYSPKQLAEGEAARLVALLEHKEMEIRAMAHENLKRITNRKGDYFRPERSPEREKSKIQRWKKLLEADQIVYAEPPSPLPKRTPVEKKKK